MLLHKPQPVGQFMQVRGEAVEDSYRMLVPVRRHGHVHLACADVDACRIGLQQGSVRDIYLLPRPLFSMAVFRLSLRFALFVPGCDGSLVLVLAGRLRLGRMGDALLVSATAKTHYPGAAMVPDIRNSAEPFALNLVPTLL